MKDRFKKAWMTLSEEERENIKIGASVYVGLFTAYVLNRAYSNKKTINIKVDRDADVCIFVRRDY